MKLKTVKLKEIVSMKYGIMPKPSIISENGYPIYSGYGVTGYAKQFLYKEPQLIVIARGVGGTGDVKISPENVWITNLSLVLELDKEKVDRTYLYYKLKKEPLKKNLNTGAAQAQITIGVLENYKVTIPELAIQKRISSNIASYDDLIDTNRRRIKLLEEAARLLFREWFVYLRFPGHEKVKIVDGVPEGWKKEKINRLVTFLGGHAFKSMSYKQEGKYGIVTIKNVQQSSFIPKCTDYLDDTPDAMKKHCILTDGDILISLTGNVGRVCLVYGENYLLNQRVAKIEAKKSIPKSFIYWMFDNPIMQKRIENLSFGSAQQNLSPIKLGEQTVIIPPDPLLESFDEIVSLMNIEIIQLLIQNQKLAQARDLLLPRLMSGEIEV